MAILPDVDVARTVAVVELEQPEDPVGPPELLADDVELPAVTWATDSSEATSPG
jgi:hypothetical protein